MEQCAICGEFKPPYKTGGDSKTYCEECCNKTHPPRVVVQPQGRNEICNCGSGKKFKKCCLK